MYKVAIDISSTYDQFAGRGVGRYTRKLLEHMVQIGSEIEWHPFGFEDSISFAKKFETLRTAFDTKQVVFHSLGPTKPSGPFNFRLWNTKYKPLVRSIQPDLYFCPEFFRGVPIGLTKTLTMIHDVIPVQTDSYSPKSPLINYLKGLVYKRSLRHALKSDHIVTNSFYSAKQIHELFQIEMSRITPIHLGLEPVKVSDAFDTQAFLRQLDLVDNRGMTRTYLLYYGGLQSNKNVETLVTAFASMLRKRNDLVLVIVGSEFKQVGKTIKPQTVEADSLFSLIRTLGILENIRLTGFTSDMELEVLRQEAAVFISLSLIEGFGFPILESMLSGTPVVASNIPIYREVGHDGALYVDLDYTDIVDKTLHLLQDKSQQADLISRGKHVAEKYKWSTTAMDTIELIRKTLNE